MTKGKKWEYVTAQSQVWAATKADRPDRRHHFVDGNMNAPMFYVPTDRSSDDDYIFTMAYSNFNRYPSASTDIEIYDTVRYSDEYDVDKIGALVLYGRQTSASYTLNQLVSTGLPGTLFIVEDVTESIDLDGEVRTQVDFVCVADGGKYSYFFADKVYNADTDDRYRYSKLTPEQLECGDVVYLTYDSPYKNSPKINLFALYLRKSDYVNPLKEYVTIYDNNNSGYTDISKYVADKSQWPPRSNIIGDVVYVDDFMLIIHSKDNSGGDVYFKALTNGQTFEYSVSEKNIALSTPSVIGKGDRVAVTGNMNGNSPDVVIRVVE